MGAQWAHGCEQADCEISAALLEKTETFQVAQRMPCFKAMLEDSLFKTPVTSAQEAWFNPVPDNAQRGLRDNDVAFGAVLAICL